MAPLAVGDVTNEISKSQMATDAIQSIAGVVLKNISAGSCSECIRRLSYLLLNLILECKVAD